MGAASGCIGFNKTRRQGAGAAACNLKPVMRHAGTHDKSVALAYPNALAAAARQKRARR